MFFLLDCTATILLSIFFYYNHISSSLYRDVTILQIKNYNIIFLPKILFPAKLKGQKKATKLDKEDMKWVNEKRSLYHQIKSKSIVIE